MLSDIPREARRPERRGTRDNEEAGGGRGRRHLHGIQQERLQVRPEGEGVRREDARLARHVRLEQHLRAHGREPRGVLRAQRRGHAEEHGDPRAGPPRVVLRRHRRQHRFGRRRQGVLVDADPHRPVREGLHRLRQGEVHDQNEDREERLGPGRPVRRRSVLRQSLRRERRRALPALHARRGRQGQRRGPRGEAPRGHAVLLQPGSRLRDGQGEGGEEVRPGGGGEGHRHDRHCHRRALGGRVPDGPDEGGAQRRRGQGNRSGGRGGSHRGRSRPVGSSVRDLLPLHCLETHDDLADGLRKN
mmetsp:Transcript_17635/g.39782  ORF Transcript_17635/g.39782 Transcript_17635/m.39782 type:complete len:302 (+) Transcript_17635:192-1097(+)